MQCFLKANTPQCGQLSDKDIVWKVLAHQAGGHRPSAVLINQGIDLHEFLIHVQDLALEDLAEADEKPELRLTLDA